jgi:hypothetical protein
VDRRNERRSAIIGRKAGGKRVERGWKEGGKGEMHGLPRKIYDDCGDLFILSFSTI